MTRGCCRSYHCWVDKESGCAVTFWSLGKDSGSGGEGGGGGGEVVCVSTVFM